MKKFIKLKITFIVSILIVCISGLARPLFEKKEIKINNKKIKVEIADNSEKQQHGLMYLKKLKDGEGMLFVFADEQIRSFWMKNTYIDLSIAYFDAQLRLINILDMKAMASDMQSDFTTYLSEKPAKYALEVPKGWFLKHKIKVGDKLVLD